MVYNVTTSLQLIHKHNFENNCQISYVKDNYGYNILYNVKLCQNIATCYSNTAEIINKEITGR